MHNLVRVLWTYRGDTRYDCSPVDDVLALLWVFPVTWIPTPFGLHQES